MSRYEQGEDEEQAEDEQDAAADALALLASWVAAPGERTGSAPADLGATAREPRS